MLVYRLFCEVSLHSSGHNSHEVWIGLTREPHNCGSRDTQINLDCRRQGWTWADVTDYRYPNWHKWGHNDPTSDELCARLLPDWSGTWFGSLCLYVHAYICEKGECALPFQFNSVL